MSEAKKIIIVDDDEDFVLSLRDLLEAYDYRVYTAYDGDSGLAKAREVQPDVMILDVMMSHETEGFEVARKIQETPELKDMGVLLVTGVTKALHLPGELEPDKTWLPVNRVLQKPISPDRLINEVERVIREKTGEDK